jgi:hypothetical protein
VNAAKHKTNDQSPSELEGRWPYIYCHSIAATFFIYPRCFCSLHTLFDGNDTTVYPSPRRNCYHVGGLEVSQINLLKLTGKSHDFKSDEIRLVYIVDLECLIWIGSALHSWSQLSNLIIQK